MIQFDWEMVRGTAAVFSALGVLASIIYFATMVKFNAAETRDATTYSIMQLAITFRSESYQGDLAEIRLKVSKGERLSDLESLRFEGYLSALFELAELVFMAHGKDKIDAEYMAAWAKRIQAAMSLLQIESFWEKAKTGYRPSFVAYVEKLRGN
jgi:hypothetical protein